MRKHEVEHLFPLFVATHRVAFEGAAPETILDAFRTPSPRFIQRSEDCVKLKVPSLVRDARARIAARMKQGTMGPPGWTEAQKQDSCESRKEGDDVDTLEFA